MTSNRLTPHLAELAANLACRRELGYPLVLGDAGSLARLAALLDPRPPASGLEAVRRDMGECTRCELHRARRNIVFGQGPADADLMIIGEAPGAREDERGEPFVGPAGALLDRMLASVGLKRREAYITNIVKCRPPANRDPAPEESGACRGFLDAQIRAIEPRVILTLGRPAAQRLLETDAPIGALRGRWRRLGRAAVLPTFHPAYLLRQPARKAQAYQDMKALAKALREGPPGEGAR